MRRHLVLALSALLVLPVLPGVGAASAATPTAGQSTYVPIDPVRLLDTRNGTGAPAGQVQAGATLDLLVAGVAGVPVDATAVVLNVTATEAPGGTDIRVYPTPTDASYPEVSNLNVGPRATVANLVTTKVGDGRRVRLRSSHSAVSLIADLSGYYVLGASGASYTAVEPRRLMDTRQTGTPLQARSPRLLTVRGGTTGVPESATAVSMNITATAGTAGTDIRVYPTRAGQSPPEVSNSNPPAGRTVPAAALVAVGDGGTVSIVSAAGTIHVVVDLAGFFTPGAEADVFHPLPPRRLLDTRSSGPAVGPAGVRDVVVAGAGTVPFPARGVVLNVTALGAAAPTDVRVYPKPGDGRVPEASNLNLVRGQTAANTVVAGVGRDGSVRLRNAASTVHLVVDIAGWYGPVGDGWDVSWPQCATAGSASTVPLPDDGAFAIVGLTRGFPFKRNECFAAEWAWASALRGEPSVYLNINAPGVTTREDGQEWARACGSAPPTSTCARAYGVAVARYALQYIPATPSGGKPMLWMDVENGSGWQSESVHANAVALNRGSLNGAVETLRAAGYRVGIYSDGHPDPRLNDWQQIMGRYQLLQTQNWVFRAPDNNPAAMCTPASSFSGGPVVLVQVHPDQSGQQFDVDHAC